MLGASLGLGVLEQAMRAARATAGAAMLQAVLDEQDDGYAAPRAGCGCGGQARPAARPAGQRRAVPGLAGVTLSPRTIERSAEAAGAGRVDERQLTGLRAAQQIGIVVHRADGNLGDGQAGQLPGVRWPADGHVS